jgi:hypothetical protein
VRESNSAARKSASGERAASSDYRSMMAQVFPDSTRVAATWFTGNLIVPDGERVTYVHMGYGSQYVPLAMRFRS